MKKVHICNRIQYAEKRHVSSVTSSAIIPVSGKTLQLIDDARNSSLIEEHAIDSGNSFVNQSLEFSCLADADLSNTMNGLILFQLEMSDGRTVVFGSTDNPAQLQGMKHSGNITQFNFYRKFTEIEF
jgi:hypothetical protein